MAMLSDLWRELDGATAKRFEEELEHEVVAGHPLFGKQTRAIAVRKLEKEAAFWLPADQRWAWVHLTWGTESSPRWPSSAVHHDWQSLVAAMREAGRE